MLQPIHLCGPTASGKSGLAIALAEAINGEIVNADAFQLFRGAPLLTAAPTPEERARVPHHLYACLDPGDRCDAMRYRQLALPVIEDIQRRGRRPIVVGGSGLYLKFLTHGPSPLPAGDPELRATLEKRPLESLVAELEQLDPVEAARTHLANRRYVTRALEVCLLSGKRCSDLRHHWQDASTTIEKSLIGGCIQRDRGDLHRRIAARTEQMLEGGAIEEVRALPPELPSLGKAIGIPQIRRFLDEGTSLAECREDILAATRQYAKRQETWFRRERWLRPLPWPADAVPPLDACMTQLSNSF
jgi:tRNA dimethylallyltransferase